MHHAKSDSEVTSLAASSPPRSPRRPVYFVQSPSRDSHDGDSKVSFQSTPLLSPMGSPLHPSSSTGGYSRSRDSSGNLGSSTTAAGGGGKRSSGGSGRLRPPSGRRAHHQQHEKSAKPWSETHVINEEEDGYSSGGKPSQIYTILLVLISCAIFLFLFILFFWLACRPSHPEMHVKSVVFHNFYVGSGSDSSGVPTKMVSLNCTVQLTFYNPSKYFGAHVSPITVNLDYSELTIGTGQLEGYFHQKRARKTVSVIVQSKKIPIYGAGASLTSLVQGKTGIPLQMSALVESQYFVVGQMVKPKFENQVVCGLSVDSANMKLLTALKSSCTYDPAASQ